MPYSNLRPVVVQRWLLPISILLITHSVWAEGEPVKVPKAAQVIKQVTAAASRMLGLKGPGRMFFALAVVLLIVLGFYLWKRRKKGAKKQDVQMEPVVGKSEVAPVAATDLLKVWRGFLKRLPGVFRRSIHNFQTFVVLGPAASGKTTVVSTYSDWQRQARQALPSETQNPRLQVYLSSQAILLEMPAGLLQDTSIAARRACTKLFARISRRRSPVVAVVLDLPSLQRMSPQAARALADGIRAKVNVLAAARSRRAAERPVEVRLVLTHLDTIPGFDALVEFAQLQEIPLRFALNLEGEESSMAAQVSQGVSGFGGYLPLALTKLSSVRYKDILVFLREGTHQFENLSVFLTALFSQDSLSERPTAGAVYWGCDHVIAQSSNPFHVPLDPSLAEKRQPWSVHTGAALGLAAIAGLWLLLGFGLERQSWQRATEAMRASSARLFTPDTRNAIRVYRERDKSVLRLLPNFYEGSESSIAQRLSRNLREFKLLPRLEMATLEEEWPRRKTLYHLALLHGSQGSDLGAIALELARGPLEREMGAGLVEDYLSATPTAFGETQTLSALPARSASNTDSHRSAFNASVWRAFLQDVQEAIESGHIAQDELEGLVGRAQQHQREILAIRKYAESRTILKLLPAYKEVFENYVADLESSSAEVKMLAPMTELLELIVATGPIQKQDSEPLTLLAFSNRIRAIVDEAASPHLLTVELQADSSGTEQASNRFEIDRSDWNRLLRKSRVRSLASAFAGQTGHANEILFRRGVEVTDVTLDVVECTTKLSRKVVLNGHYTGLAYKVHVRPALDKFVRAMDSLRGLLGEPELQGLLAGVQHKMIQYASSYRSQIDQFYDEGFAICEGAGDTLAVTFGELAQSTSTLTAFLDVVHVNTDLNLTLGEAKPASESSTKQESTTLLKPLWDQLEPYRIIHKIVHIEEGVPRELDKFLLIMDQVRTRLTAGESPLAAVPGEEGLPGTLHDQLNPVGQIVLERVTDPDDNALTLVENWTANMGLQGRLARPFQRASGLLRLAGDHDLKRVVESVWHHEVLRHLSRLFRKFPFERSAKMEVTSLELEQAFHPKEGLVFDRYRRFLEPVTRRVSGGAYAGRRNGPRLPKNMIRLLNRIGVLTNALWDAKGAPKPLAIRVRAIPFEPTRDMRSALTLAYLRFGDVSVFNFNQRPATKALALPWGTPQISQVGVQLTNARNGQQRYPRSLVTTPSHFSALRLLLLSKTPELGATFREPDGHVLSERRWEIPFSSSPAEQGGQSAKQGETGTAGTATTERVSARFLVEEQLLDMFDFAELARQGEKRFAALTSEGER